MNSDSVLVCIRQWLRQLLARPGSWIQGIFLTVGFLLALSWVWSGSNPLVSFDQNIFDLVLRARNALGLAPAWPPNVIVVSLDDADLERTKGYEDEYAALARAVRQLNDLGVEVIAVDVIFSRGAEDMANDLLLALEQTPRVVLATAMLGEGGRLLEPFPFRTKPPGEMGLINISPDSDGVYRRYPLVQPVGDTWKPSLALAAYLAALEADWEGQVAIRPDRQVIVWKDVNDQDETFDRVLGLADFERKTLLNLRSNWSDTSSGGIPHLSLSQLDDYHQQFQQAAPGEPNPFRQATVLLGYSATGVVDAGPTALAAHEPKLLLHANALADLIQSTFIREVPSVWTLVVALAVWPLGMFLTRGVAAGYWPHLATLAAGVLVICAAVLALLLLGGLWLPPLGILVYWCLGAGGELLHQAAIDRREYERTRTQLEVSVSSEIAAMLLESPDNSWKEGQSVDVAILFTDVRGFSEIARQLDSRETLQKLNEVMAFQTEAANSENGTVIGYWGDAMLAVWGFPVRKESASENVARMMRCAEKIDQAYGMQATEGGRGRAMRVGLGMHAGEVNAGALGSRTRQIITVLGDSVNVGSRIEGLTKHYGLSRLFSGQVASLLPRDLQTRALRVDRVILKGRDELQVDLFAIDPVAEADRQPYTKALEAYLAGDFAPAARRFAALEGSLPRMMARRCDAYFRGNVLESWQGAFPCDTK